MSIVDQVAPARAALVLHEELSHGLHGANARIEIHEPSGVRIARLALRGWIDDIALKRLTRRIEDLARQGVARLEVDLSGVRHVDYRLVPDLTELLARFEARAGDVLVSGVSSYLRDILRLAGCESRLDLRSAAAPIGSRRGLAS